MTTEEFISFGNALQSLAFRLWNNENMNMWLTYRNEKIKGHFYDVTLFFYNDNTTIEYRYNFLKAYSLDEAKNKLEELNEVIQTLG